MFCRHAAAVSSCRWQPLPAPLRAACSPGKREKARCRSTAATHRTNREKDNNEPTPCVRSLLFVYRQALKRKKNELMKPSTRSWWGKVDSLFCGKATPVAACHRHTAKSRLSNPKIQKLSSKHKCLLDNGGGRWIRTTEVTDNRFTVCPLWPLGNSPIFNYGACRWSW